MLQKKNTFYLEKSSIRTTTNVKPNFENRNRKLSENLAFTNMNSFKHFGSVVRVNTR